ncbi:MAG: hypothetical protein JWP89_1329 [Schlesneria sp.]|nr:hypothetical protein [Schlesneria sp.]
MGLRPEMIHCRLLMGFFWLCFSVALAQGADGGSLLIRLQDFRRQVARPLLVSEVDSMSKGVVRTSDEWRAAWRWLKEDQGGGYIKFADLAAFAASRRDLLQSVDLSYKYRRSLKREKRFQRGECEFAFAGERTLYKERTTEKGPLGLASVTVADGPVWRVVFPNEAGDFVNQIKPAGDLDALYADENPLMLVGAVDSRRAFESGLKRDFVAIFESWSSAEDVLIQAAPEVVGGESCVLVAIGASVDKYYFGIERGLALVRIEVNTCGISPEKEWGCVETRTLDCSGFEEHGGVWFPMKIATATRVLGVIEQTLDVEVTSVRANHEIPSHRFVDVFKRGEMVYDSFRNLYYENGRDPTVEGTLSRLVEKRSLGVRWWLIFINAFVACCFLYWFAVSRKRPA